jgi:hypothetical protein
VYATNQENTRIFQIIELSEDSTMFFLMPNKQNQNGIDNFHTMLYLYLFINLNDKKNIVMMCPSHTLNAQCYQIC